MLHLPPARFLPSLLLSLHAFVDSLCCCLSLILWQATGVTPTPLPLRHLLHLNGSFLFLFCFSVIPCLLTIFHLPGCPYYTKNSRKTHASTSTSNRRFFNFFLLSPCFSLSVPFTTHCVTSTIFTSYYHDVYFSSFFSFISHRVTRVHLRSLSTFCLFFSPLSTSTLCLSLALMIIILAFRTHTHTPLFYLSYVCFSVCFS